MHTAFAEHSPSPRKTIMFILKVLFLAGVAAFVVHEVSVENLREVLGNIDPANAVIWIAFGVLAKLAGIFSGILRWRLLLHGQGLHLPLWYLAKCWFMGRAVGLFLPSTLGLDGYRLVQSARYTGEPVGAAAVIAVEKVLGFTALFLLVFLTAPLATRFIDFQPLTLSIVLIVLACIVGAALLLLMRPRALQVILETLPAPGPLRRLAQRLSAALHAYSGRYGLLLTALLLGVGVHLGICLMYFGCAMAVRAPNTNIWDVLFISPLVIVGGIITPTLSGAGVRELGFMTLLAEKAGVEAGLLVGHLGLWVGEVVPFLLSLPLLLLAGRPEPGELKAQAADVHAATRDASTGLALAPEAIARYRRGMVHAVLAAAFGALAGGALIGMGEGIWILNAVADFSEQSALWWAPLAYGIACALLGLGGGAALVFLYLVVNRFPAPAWSFSIGAGATVFLGAAVIGIWRYKRDVLAGHMPGLGQAALVLGAALAGGLIVAALARLAASRGGIWRAAAAGAAVFAATLVCGAAAAAILGETPDAEPASVAAEQAAEGPNIILIVADALRADALRLYDADAPVETPALDALAADGALFLGAFSQASWTKPSFATIFSGLYPGAHGAESKASALPESIETFPEALRERGYYVHGYANNPNITAAYDFDQGFHEYVDLKPSLHFGAGSSAARTAAYEVLRRVRQRAVDLLPGGGTNVEDFYQPAQEVTGQALAWLENAPEDRPFFLFLHYMDPHDPYMERVGEETPNVGYARVRMENPDPKRFRDPMKDAYHSEVRYMDRHIGRFIEGLKARGLYEDSLVVFTSDHGEEFYDHEGWWHGKTLYDEVIRVPLIMKLPQSGRGGEQLEELVELVDLAPTLLAHAGAGRPDAMMGRALLEEEARGLIYAENDFEGNVLHAVRTAEDKLILANEGNPRGLAPREFYRVGEDPAEQVNLAGEDLPAEERLESLLDDMRAHVEENAAAPVLREPDESGDAELEERMRALGYM